MATAVEQTSQFSLASINRQTDATPTQDELGQSEFLQMLTTQMKSQDPTSPMDSSQFLTDIAQFSMVSGIQNLEESFKQFSSAMLGNQALEAANLIGRTVLVGGKEGVLSASHGIEGTFQMDQSSSAVSVSYLDSSGAIIKQTKLNETAAGEHSFSWNGLLDDGTQAPEGNYTVFVEADQGGENTALNTQIFQRVQSVTLGDSSNPALTLTIENQQQVALTNVSQIR